MASCKNYNFKIDLSNIPIKNGSIYNWKYSVGKVVSFTSDEINGELLIVEYIPKRTVSDNSYLITKYKNNILKPITVQCLKNGQLSGILFDYLFKWKFEIDEEIHEFDKDLIIIDRKYENGIQFYKYKCLRCGFECGNHFLNQEYKQEYWISVNQFKTRKGCACCNQHSKVVVPGINDITTTDPWMIPYFQGGEEEAKKYTSNSSKKIIPVCPDCGTIEKKENIISNIKNNHGILCACKDTVSYPNKFIYYLFKQLENSVDYYNTEYTPYWLKPYRYDLYFEINNKKYSIEMDGGVGHGNHKYKSNEIDIIGLENDKKKDELSIINNVTVIRIDCLKSDFEYIKNNTIKSIEKIVDLTNVDWKLLELNCLSNLTKTICECYNSNNSIKETSNKLKISNNTVTNALEKGNKFNWCTYVKLSDKKKDNINKCIEMINKHPEYTINEISLCLNLSEYAIRNYLKELGEYEDYLKNHEIKNRLKRIESSINTTSKIVYVYDLNLNFLRKYKSVNELERKSIKDFGVELKSRCVSRVCLGGRKQYKGFIFSYKKLHNE